MWYSRTGRRISSFRIIEIFSIIEDIISQVLLKMILQGVKKRHEENESDLRSTHLCTEHFIYFFKKTRTNAERSV